MTYKIHPHLKSLKRSATLAINEQCAKLTSAGITVTRFGFGQSPFPVPEFLVEELRKNAYRKEYLPVEGLYSLREAIAEYHSIADKIVMDPEGIIVGPGSKELIFTLQLVTKGTTLIPSPCWVSYGPQADIVQKKIHYIQTQYEHSWRLLPHELESAIQFTDDPQLLILNYPGNPGGGSYSPDELAAIAEVCRKYGVLVLSDEIYGRLHHNNDHISIARYYPEGTIVSSGLSKWCGAGGWRLGHFAFPKELLILKNMMTTITSETFSCVASPVQFAALKAYGNSPMINEYLFHCRRILKTIGNDCYYRLTSAGVRLIEPKGSFYLFPDFENFRKNLEKREIDQASLLCDQLLQETGVALLPGSEFGRSKRELNARLAYVNFDGSKALTISRKIPNNKDLTINNLIDVTANITAGINHIIQWIRN